VAHAAVLNQGSAAGISHLCEAHRRWYNLWCALLQLNFRCIYTSCKINFKKLQQIKKGLNI
jgi:hypothetical protein